MARRNSQDPLQGIMSTILGKSDNLFSRRSSCWTALSRPSFTLRGSHLVTQLCLLGTTAPAAFTFFQLSLQLPSSGRDARYRRMAKIAWASQRQSPLEVCPPGAQPRLEKARLLKGFSTRMQMRMPARSGSPRCEVTTRRRRPPLGANDEAASQTLRIEH